MDAATISSLVVGGWGAVVATVLGVREMRRDRRIVMVECETRWGKLPAQATGYGTVSAAPGLVDELFVRVRVQNLGHRPVEPRHVFFLTRSGRRLPVRMERGMPLHQGEGRQLPRRLGDGEAVVVDFPTRMLEQAQAQTQTPIETVEVQASGELYRAPFPRY